MVLIFWLFLYNYSWITLFYLISYSKYFLIFSAKYDYCFILSSSYRFILFIIWQYDNKSFLKICFLASRIQIRDARSHFHVLLLCRWVVLCFVAFNSIVFGIVNLSPWGISNWIRSKVWDCKRKGIVLWFPCQFVGRNCKFRWWSQLIPMASSRTW